MIRNIHPAGSAARIEAIDVLRGLALFGVLAVNLVSEFRVSIFEQFLPAPPAPPLDRAVGAFLRAVVEFKAFALFSFLFGLGLAIQFDRLAGRSDRLALLLRRLLALLGFGLVHLLLIWNGDILTEYALAGLLVLPALFAPRWVLAVLAGVALALYAAMPWLPLPWGFPSAAWLSAHVAAAREVYGHGTYAAIQAFRVAEIPAIAVLHGYAFPRTVGLMLLGMLAWRSGIVGRPRRLGGVAAAALAVGVVLSAMALGRAGPPVAWALATVVLALGYAALTGWVVMATRWGWLLAWAGPAGRMAFSNYVTQSVGLGLLFHGYGLGWMGQVGVAAGLVLAVTIYAVQAVVSAWWLRSHAFGPLEWLWRTLTYGEKQPWRHRRRKPAPGPSSEKA